MSAHVAAMVMDKKLMTMSGFTPFLGKLAPSFDNRNYLDSRGIRANGLGHIGLGDLGEVMPMNAALGKTPPPPGLTQAQLIQWTQQQMNAVYLAMGQPIPFPAAGLPGDPLNAPPTSGTPATATPGTVPAQPPTTTLPPSEPTVGPGGSPGKADSQAAAAAGTDVLHASTGGIPNWGIFAGLAVAGVAAYFLLRR